MEVEGVESVSATDIGTDGVVHDNVFSHCHVYDTVATGCVVVEDVNVRAKCVVDHERGGPVWGVRVRGGVVAKGVCGVFVVGGVDSEVEGNEAVAVVDGVFAEKVGARGMARVKMMATPDPAAIQLGLTDGLVDRVIVLGHHLDGKSEVVVAEIAVLNEAEDGVGLDNVSDWEVVTGGGVVLVCPLRRVAIVVNFECGAIARAEDAVA